MQLYSLIANFYAVLLSNPLKLVKQVGLFQFEEMFFLNNKSLTFHSETIQRKLELQRRAVYELLNYYDETSEKTFLATLVNVLGEIIHDHWYYGMIEKVHPIIRRVNHLERDDQSKKIVETLLGETLVPLKFIENLYKDPRGALNANLKLSE